MKVRLITTLLAAHGVVALKSGEASDDVSTNSNRYRSLQRTPTSLDSLMARSDERKYPRLSIEGQPGPHERILKGRFLHITDFHPDPHYISGGSFDSGCHRKPEDDVVANSLKMSSSMSGIDGLHGNASLKRKDDDDKDVAGKWGSGASDCDAPMSLVNLTFDWLRKEWAEEVDFVVWTGDNARHDIDREIPRTPKEIYELNRMMVGKMRDAFGEDVVIVPSIGNNDIWPHNILQPGPNAVTNEFSNIWSDFIPAEEYHVFQRGAYYSSEVIPDKLAVISLNTIYWYDANKAVDGCKDGSDEPGALEFDWLEVQLDSFRERGMQVWLTGHVPPHMGLYFDNCYLRYGELALRFQDTIVGHLFGHQNVDHFFFIDVEELESTTGFAGKTQQAAMFSERVNTFGRNTNTALQQDLLRDFGDMPKVSKMKLEDYTVVNVSPSVIPTYLPGVRVYSYNVTGLRLEEGILDQSQEDATWLPTERQDIYTDGMDTQKRRTGHRHRKKKKKNKKKNECSKPEHEDQPHCKFRQKERHFSPDSPSRSNTLFTPLGYAQFYLPDIDVQTEAVPEWFIEYTTYSQDGLLRGGRNGTDGDVQGRQPVPWHLLPGYRELIEHEDTSHDNHSSPNLKGKPDGKEISGKDPYAKFRAGLKKITPYHLEDLTIPSYAHFAKKLATDKHLWKRFASAMYLTTKDDK